MSGVSHGRGGAGKIPARTTHPLIRLGNIYTQDEPKIHTPKDLVTPSIKQDVYTTGRGGSGNMMHNDPKHPEIARESQDVETPPQRVEDAPHHTGRGGAANAYFPPPEEEEKVRKQEEEQLRQARDASRDRLKAVEAGEMGNQPAKD